MYLSYSLGCKGVPVSFQFILSENYSFEESEFHVLLFHLDLLCFKF